MTDATPFRNLWFASVTLFLASVAHAALPQAPAQPSAHIREHFQRAQAALQANDSASAEREFQAVLALDPRNPGAHAGMGVLAMGRSDWRAASEEFHSALAAQPSFTKALALLGICQKRLGDGSARTSLQKSFQRLQEKPLRVQVGMELVGLYENEGDAEHAAAVLQKLMEINPDNVEILFTAQRLYRGLADDTLNKLAVVAPGSARMQQVIAQHLINQGDLKGAIDHYRRALRIDPRVTGAHFELGEAILESAPNDEEAQAEALNEFQAAIASDGDTAKTQCALARIALVQSGPEQALAHYQRAFQLDPHGTQAQIGLAKLIVHREPQRAVEYLRMAVQSDPLNGSAHYQLARAYKQLGESEMAQKEFQLFQDIKKTKDQVKAVYRQMNRQPKPEADEGLENGDPQKEQ